MWHSTPNQARATMPQSHSMSNVSGSESFIASISSSVTVTVLPLLSTKLVCYLPKKINTIKIKKDDNCTTIVKYFAGVFHWK